LTANVLIFGNELVTSGISGEGKVRDSLGPQIPLWLESLGIQCLSVMHIHDTLDAHIEALAQSTADVIVTSGGTAAGPVDFLHEAIRVRGGRLLVDAVKVRPGYHQLVAQIDSQFVISLPGNPQSAVIGLLTLGQPLAAASYRQQFPTWIDKELGEDFPNNSEDARLVLVCLHKDQAKSVEFTDSSMLRGFASAHGYCLIPAGGKSKGDVAEFWALP
jgi:molybdopterin molybdotransferase